MEVVAIMTRLCIRLCNHLCRCADARVSAPRLPLSHLVTSMILPWLSARVMTPLSAGMAAVD